MQGSLVNPPGEGSACLPVGRHRFRTSSESQSLEQEKWDPSELRGPQMAPVILERPWEKTGEEPAWASSLPAPPLTWTATNQVSWTEGGPHTLPGHTLFPTSW